MTFILSMYSSSIKQTKKRKRQERFSDVLECLDNGGDGELEDELGDAFATIRPYLTKLSKEHESVPRKRNKFVSYAKRSLRVEDEAIINRLFDFIESKVKSVETEEVFFFFFFLLFFFFFLSDSLNGCPS
jgi:hypothetical protein